MVGADIRPFGQIGLAQDDRAGRSQACGDRRVAASDVILQRQGAGRRRHVVGGFDIILDQDGNAGERPLGLAGRPRRVRLSGDRRRIRIEGDHRVQPRVQPGDALLVKPHQLDRGRPPGEQVGLDLSQGFLPRIIGRRRRRKGQSKDRAGGDAHDDVSQGADLGCGNKRRKRVGGVGKRPTLSSFGLPC